VNFVVIGYKQFEMRLVSLRKVRFVEVKYQVTESVTRHTTIAIVSYLVM